MLLAHFLAWTFVLYWIHRASHKIPGVRQIHFSHHIFISKNTVKWHWNNLFLYNDNFQSSLDLWITEVLPTLIYCIIFQTWWILLFYYVWAALIQERIEHNPLFNLPVLTSGSWHLIHHSSPFNYGLFLPTWDLVFNTYRKIK
jgi:sterol desaturase/sphingolipid hydroxylase (fatty acid hydroxylase superfamily)